MAGESAREVARRHREKIERLQRSQERWERGAEGEEATAAALAALPDGWTVLHDVAWPGRPRANLDHVVIGPAGVFVIDSKNWTGTITVRDDVLRQGGRSRETTVAAAAEAAIAVAQLTTALTVHQVRSVVCFAREERLTGWARDVMVCSTSTLVEMLTTRPPVLHPTRVAAVAGDLGRRLPPRPATAAPAQPAAVPPPAGVDLAPAAGPAESVQVAPRRRSRAAPGARSDRGTPRRARRRRSGALQEVRRLVVLLALVLLAYLAAPYSQVVTDPLGRLLGGIVMNAMPDSPPPAP